MSLKINVSKVSTDDRSDGLPHTVCLAQELINGFLWGWRLIMLYQLYGLLRDNQATSHPPLLSPGRREPQLPVAGPRGGVKGVRPFI